MSHDLEILTEDSSQWNTVSIIAPEIKKKEIKPFVVLALKNLEGTPDSRTSSLMRVEKFAAVDAVMRHFTRLKSATKTMWSPDDVKNFLEGLSFSSECIAEFTPLLCSESIYDSVPKHLRVKPGLLSLSWKIDMSLSQSTIESENASFQRCKEIMHHDTFVVLILNMTDGTTRLYRISLNKFHEMRYTIAVLLKNMIVLEKRKCMKKD